MNSTIALWTHPRSISTAFERVMMERGDFKILHEPFSYLYYVKGTNASIEQEYIDPSHPTDYQGIRNHILTTSSSESVFFKDMCSHCSSDLLADADFLTRISNTFLVRDPAKTIASYYAMNPEVTLEEIGLEQLCLVFEKVAELAGEIPPVIDADDLEDKPNGTMKAYCQRLDIPYIAEAMTWHAEHKKEWDIWKDWHRDAAQSTGIVKSMEQFESTVANNSQLQAYYQSLLPFYERMHRHRLLPVASTE